MMNPPSPNKLDLADIRARLSEKKGRTYWRGLEELANTEEFQEYLHREFPKHASEWCESLDRRQFVSLMAASLALGGVTGCSIEKPGEKIVPYVEQPENVVPGKPLYYATAMPQGESAIGLLVESHMGRPTKIEGNPDHPGSLGATDAFAQATILTMYDPDRSTTARHLGEISTWEAMLLDLRSKLTVERNRQGSGLRIITGAFSSPTLGRQMEELFQQYPQARWCVHEPVNEDAAHAASQAVFGQRVNTLYRFDQANVVVALDSDFLGSGAANVRYAHDFMNRRRVSDGQTTMNRLYSIESTPTNTGAAADNRLGLPAGEVEGFARRLAAALGVSAGAAAGGSDEQTRWIEAVAADLQANRGSSVVIAGEHQSPAVHALAHAINAALGNVGQTVIYTEPLQAGPIENISTLNELVDDLDAGNVEVLLIIGSNPVYTAPADLEFAKRLDKAGLVIHLGMYQDETSYLSHWHVPQSHFLEGWSDARTLDGTATIIQPLIAPLYPSHTAHELLSAVVDQGAVQQPYDLVRTTWQQFHEQQTGDDQQPFEKFWRAAVHSGVVAGSTFESVNVEVDTSASLLQDPQPQVAQAADELEIIFQPDPTIWDGRYANNGWLQELPKPLTKLTWDNVALVSLTLAEKLGLQNEDMIRLEYDGRSIEAPVWVSFGQPAQSVTVLLGYGRTAVGRVGNGIGYNAYALRTSARPSFAWGLSVTKLQRRYPLATTQTHHNLEGRAIVRTATFDEYQADPNFAHAHEHHVEDGPPISFYPDYEHNGYAWGMAIDMSTCVGCNACVVACQAENNIPIVGKSGVIRGREMHWLRIDRYFEGTDLNNPKVFLQPMLCQHCEKAPCEVVCPVAATSHSPEGLNEMTYNRCVGTRYCSNNCPYKVRRFNFFNYTDYQEPVLSLLQNPDVTVRSRGVMEKCSFCVQRINNARIEAKTRAINTPKDERNAPDEPVNSPANVRIPDGTLVTACQQACPTQAIVFGDINDPDARVTQLKKSPLNFSVLGEIGTQPRTTYLARVTNPNPALEPQQQESEASHSAGGHA